MANVTRCAPGRTGVVSSGVGGEFIDGVVITGAGAVVRPPEWPFGGPAEGPFEEHAPSSNTKATKPIRIVISKTHTKSYWRDYRV